MDLTKVLSEEFSLNPKHVANTVQLIDEGNTIPFIARYRKELTGSLDDQVLRELYERLGYLRTLEARKTEVKNTIEGQEKLTPELAAAIDGCITLAEVEDLYRPYRPKRKTRASMAKEKGLEPLALYILAQASGCRPPLEEAIHYVDAEKGVDSAEAALDGAMDIIAESVSDDANIRKELRTLIFQEGVLTSTAAKEGAESVYEMYYEFSEAISKVASHRVLALDRGEREEFLKVNIDLPRDAALNLIIGHTLKRESPCSKVILKACIDSFDRLIFPSIQREVRNTLTERACEQAIKLFSLNLRNLLLQPPVKGKVALGFDPGYRTGCKVAVVDATGRVLTTDVVYPTTNQTDRIAKAKVTIKGLIQKYGVQVIAIGNGTASKESELFIAEVIRELGGDTAYIVVSEAGASVYSASKLAAAEFPDYDVSLRSAVSIARRLQDPLAELVKIDPKAIGVGQYQHDMPKAQLDEALEGVVESCVNSVGVDLNTASVPLLTHVAGVNASVAKNIVAFREENGPYTARTQLKKVPRLGAKAYEQCAGFLRIPDGKNSLDRTAVHPESYAAAKKLLELLGYQVKEIGTPAIADLKQKVLHRGLAETAAELEVGVPTLQDIMEELLKPGRDLRDSLPPPLLRTDILSMNDLRPGMALRGTVRNVIDFGAFVDIGVHQDGLVHISQLSDHFVKHPTDVVKVGDVVDVKVLSVDLQKKRISLTMKDMGEN